MNKDKLISDAIKITDIGFASEDSIRARELVKSAMVENPFLGKIASAKLDTPLFIFRNMSLRAQILMKADFEIAGLASRSKVI